ncbi:hypothetical protein [Humidesulfovibrio idahonensis]
MTITRLTWPSLKMRPISWSWRTIANTQTWTSPLNGSEQTAELPGARWWFRVGYQNMREDDWRMVDAFLAQLRGMAGRVLLSPLHGEAPRGVATGLPIVYGADQLGRSMATSGWTANTAHILRVGDYFSVPTLSGPELKIITADVASDAAGKATLTFEPPLRNSPDNGASITVADPVCPMRLKDGDQGEFALTNMRLGSVTLEFAESWI